MTACVQCRDWTTRVIDSRKNPANGWVYRRRVCACGERYTTVEVPLADVVQQAPASTPTEDADGRASC